MWMRSRAVLAGLALLVWAGCAMAVDTEEEAAVRAAAHRAIAAMNGTDIAAYKVAVIWDEASLARFERTAKMNAAHIAALDLLKRRFGDAAAFVIESKRINFFPVTDAIKNATIAIDGDMAILKASKPMSYNVTMKKAEGQWRQVLRPLASELAQRVATETDGYLKVWEGLSADLQAGKFANPDEFRQALEERDKEVYRRPATTTSRPSDK